MKIQWLYNKIILCEKEESDDMMVGAGEWVIGMRKLCYMYNNCPVCVFSQYSTNCGSVMVWRSVLDYGEAC